MTVQTDATQILTRESVNSTSNVVNQRECFEILSPPPGGDQGAARAGVAKSHLRAGSLQQGLGDEHAETHATMAAAGWFSVAAAGDIGLSQSREDFWFKAWPVVANLNRLGVLLLLRRVVGDGCRLRRDRG